jgi:Arylsulfatase A and related enzymes
MCETSSTSISRRAFTAALGGAAFASAQQSPKPNILWITCEDIGPQLGCYGDKYSQTPNLDRMAAQGTRI